MINPLNIKKFDHHVNFFSSTLKQNIVEQAASMLLQHVTCNKHFYPITQNSNGNALDERHLSLHHIQRKNKDFRRTNKCNLWLSKLPTKSDTSLNRLPIFIKSPSYRHESRAYSPSIHLYPPIESSKFSVKKSHYIPSRIHQNQMTLSSNAAPNINPQFQSESQPLIMVHKKRLRRDYFLSTMQNSIQSPYSQNHFYAFDQTNLLKLQRNLHSIDTDNAHYHPTNYFPPKRKYSEDYHNESECICSETQLNRTSPSKKHLPSSPKTADHISINKYHNEQKPDIDLSIEEQKSHQVLSRLEKILNLCGELRSLANDVEIHLNEQSISKPISSEINDQDHTKEYQSEQTINETIASPPYRTTNDTSSIHSGSNKSIQLMQTESFKSKSASLTTSHTKLRQSEDICSCFLKSFLEKQNCELNADEQEYLNELTKAYILGREQILKEQQEANNKFQAFINETLPDDQQDPSSLVHDTNNNNQSIAPVSPSSILFYNDLSSVPLKSNDSTNVLEQQASTPSGTNSVKYQIFINEPIAMKTTNALPGIGIKYAEQLADCGFSTVRRLLGFYLMIKDDQQFVIWLNNNAQITIHSAWLCTNALRAWCQAHL